MTSEPGARKVASALLACLALSCACAPRRPHEPVPGAPASFGVYDAKLVAEDGSARRFRLLLYAALPDRVHAEVLPPVGGPRLVLDGGAGRLAVALVEERLAYVGDAEAGSLERVLGVRVTLASFVSALLLGHPAQAGEVSMRREPESGSGLPSSFELRRGSSALSLLRKKDGRRVLALGAAVGSGTPPAGFRVLPLTELSLESGSLLDRQTGS